MTYVLLDLFFKSNVKSGTYSSLSEQILCSFATFSHQPFRLWMMRNIGEESEVTFQINGLKSHILSSLLSLSVFTYLEKQIETRDCLLNCSILQESSWGEQRIM